MRDENTIYIRQRPRAGAHKRWETFAKAQGEGFILSVEGGREENIEAAALVLWAINKWGPEAYHDHRPFDMHPERPETFDYPVIDEV